MLYERYPLEVMVYVMTDGRVTFLSITCRYSIGGKGDRMKDTTDWNFGESLPDGMYHLAVEIIVKHTDGTYLLMQRDFTKHYSRMWALTAGGSAL